ncbi:MAG: outer membrane protein assembly factor BamB [Gammaproteobacteria bacterium]|nr:outer membrane protein assembly factor BamB [Gammaproteobacteria bacterium]
MMISNLVRFVIGFLFLLILSGCGTVSNWLEEDVYEAPPTELTEFVAEFEPQVVWSTDTGSGAGNDYNDLAAWVQGDMVIAVDYEGEVASYNIQTGKQLWRIDLDVPVVSGAGGGSGLVLVGTQEGEIIALDEVQGDVKWKKKLSSEVLAPPKAAMGIAVARTADGRISGLSIEDGQILWSYQRAVPLLSLRGASEPVIADDKVISGYANGKLVALSILDGNVIWEKSVAVPRGRTELDRLVDIDSAPVIKDGIVYVVAYHGRLAALSLESGRILWTRDMSSRSGLDVAGGDSVYVSDDSDYVWALQDGSGDALWRQTRLLRRKVTAPVIVGNHIIVGDFEGYVHWISREDGHFVARTRVANNAIRSKPVVKDDLVFLTASDGTLTAFRIQ